MIERVTMMLLLLAAGTALAQSPGTHYPSGGTRPGVSPQAGAGSNAPYARTITVYGNVNTNDLLRFMDRTGSRVSGTNVLGALDYYGTNWQARVNALTNGAALGATALQPSWAATGTVANAAYAETANHAETAGYAATAEASSASGAINAGTADELDRDYPDGQALDALIVHTNSPAAHPDIRALIPTLPGPGCTELDYAADGTNVTITGATYSYFFAPDKAYTLSVAPDAPRYHYSIEIIGDHACTLPAGHRLRGAWTLTGTNEVVVAPSTGTVWNVFGRGL